MHTVPRSIYPYFLVVSGFRQDISLFALRGVRVHTCRHQQVFVANLEENYFGTAKLPTVVRLSMSLDLKTQQNEGQHQEDRHGSGVLWNAHVEHASQRRVHQKGSELQGDLCYKT